MYPRRKQMYGMPMDIKSYDPINAQLSINDGYVIKGVPKRTRIGSSWNEGPDREGFEAFASHHFDDKPFLHGYKYYHGMIPNSDVPDLLEEDGDFLLRKELINDNLLVTALSVRCGDAVKHFMINQTPKGEFYIEGLRADTVEKLIQKHLETQEPLSKASQAFLKRAIPRQDWMLNHEDIVLKESLGQHHLVEEYEGELIQHNVVRPVLLKVVSIDGAIGARCRLLKEARILRSLHHENVAKTYGIALHYSPIILVLEHFNDSLQSYLKRREVSLKEKRRFVCEAAAGMSHLAQKGCIHRDIAARNCMLTNDLRVKISGFSLSEDSHNERCALGSQVAVKWQPPEVLSSQKYSSRSDVWSFGVLMWEVYMDGTEPYPDMTPNVVKRVIINDEYRLPIPKDCPEVVARIMALCWESFPRRRPCMQAIHLVIRDC
ncbi:hypothetical protein Q1695_015104 [Nippostrongylus brasiliensis]|nr:hypothetical protein Q1695_015104 [Nippostrongylus brasiliensis]